jgi:predicted enzyme related to lactoylglutathione lyase
LINSIHKEVFNQGAAAMTMFKDVNVVQYPVRDWEGAKKFYTEVLDWPVAYVDDQMGWMEFGEEGKTHFAINHKVDVEIQPSGMSGVIAVLTVEDAGATVVALRARGIRCEDVNVIPNVVAVGAFYDPEGNCIQFVSSLAPGTTT